MSAVCRILLLAPLALAAGCAGGRSAVLPDADSSAARLYAARCGTCHAAPHPRRLAYPAWQALLPLMERRMRDRHQAPLTETERTQILAYLRAHAR